MSTILVISGQTYGQTYICISSIHTPELLRRSGKILIRTWLWRLQKLVNNTVYKYGRLNKKILEIWKKTFGSLAWKKLKQTNKVIKMSAELRRTGIHRLQVGRVNHCTSTARQRKSCFNQIPFHLNVFLFGGYWSSV